MSANTATEGEDETENYDVDDVIGKWIKAGEMMGLGVAVDHKVVRNGYGDERYVFVTTRPESGTTFRDVDEVLEALNSGTYHLEENPWADEMDI